MEFALKIEDWTDDAASLWGDMLGLDRPATFDEALADFEANGFGGNFDDYFDAGEYKGPCALGVSVHGVEGTKVEAGT